MLERRLKMVRWKKFGLLVLLDTFLINIAFLGAYVIRFESWSYEIWPTHFSVLVVVSGIHLACNYFFGLYRRAWRYASINEVMAIVGAVSVATIFSVSVIFFAFAFLVP